MKLSELPTEVQLALLPLASALDAAHLAPSRWEYSDSLGNFLVAFRGPDREITLTLDRGQFIVGGSDRASLKETGLGGHLTQPKSCSLICPAGSVKGTGPNNSFKPKPLRGSA